MELILALKFLSPLFLKEFASPCPNNQLLGLKSNDMTFIKKSKNVSNFIYLCYWQRDRKLSTSYPALQTLHKANNSVALITAVDRNRESVLVKSTFALCTLYRPALQLMLWCWIKPY
ncbi:hypothetical protein MJG53_018411 [Ovis ammon polii x Ovis aries]|uniref:Uncharacterized protein n=2 Tax=Ovis TaxID=9935 RepID=A0A835ZN44_SHEEP|nr:hypothetical protein JEQ12_012768 [Ovis aries]KAI4559885.1 hypothetical protein MJG53_018411 [Ovis ammon polii x Ovis aries]